MNTPDTEWEKEKEEFNKMWNEGKFHWNENQNTEINPQRIWNVFIQPMLTSRDTYWKERVERMKYDRENSLISPLESYRHEDIEYGFNQAKSILLDNLK